MSPLTDRIIEVYGETKDHELLKHAQRMESGLREAFRELQRVNDIIDGRPLVSRNLMLHLGALLK